MRLPGIVAAQRLQSWLLIAALLSVVLIGLLVVDLTRNLRTVVISETEKSLHNAAQELMQVGRSSLPARDTLVTLDARLDLQLKRASYEILRSYPEVEGGFLLQNQVAGHSFPTHTEPDSDLHLPANESREIMAALTAAAAAGRPATRILQDGNDLVVVAAAAGGGGLSAWCLRRIFNFSDSNEINKRLILVAVMFVALLSIGVVLRLSFSMQSGFAQIQSGLERLRTDASYRLPDQDHELRSIVRELNVMAEGRQKLEEDLRREDRLRVMGRVVAGIAHEIRNPLNSIRLTIRLLARRLEAEPSTQEPIALVTSEVDRLDTLLRSLLVFRPDATEKIRQQPVQPILDRTIALVKPHAEESGVAIRAARCEEALAFVDGDYLQQALMNLLLNAIDASTRNGVVELLTSQENGRLQIEIEDSGPGLTSEQEERIFEAFYTTKAGGTGLGLAVTRTLLEKMGATVAAVPGKRGARFRVALRTEHRA
ncbi:MAG TPA: ATP-binding protein [Bryobacteraceae bacterium]|nr:ATP-binding protein [Bryobacteraceae bacterium]